MSIRRVESIVRGASQNGRLHEVLSVGYAQPRLVNPWEGPPPVKTPLAPPKPFEAVATPDLRKAIATGDVNRFELLISRYKEQLAQPKFDKLVADLNKEFEENGKRAFKVTLDNALL